MVADVWIVWYSARQEGVRFEGVGKQGVYRIPVMLALLIGIWQFCTKKAITFMSKLKMTSAKWFLKNRYSSKKLLSYLEKCVLETRCLRKDPHASFFL